MLTPDERTIVNQFMAAISYVKTGSDDFPSWPHQALEIDGLERVAMQVAELSSTWFVDDDAERRSLYELSRATMELCGAVDPRLPDSNSSDPEIPEEFFRARATLIQPATD